MPSFRQVSLAGALLATGLTAGATAVIWDGGSSQPAGGRLSVADPYIPLPAGDAMAAGYLTVRNTGGTTDTLVKVTSPEASSVTIHQSTASSMTEVGSLPVPAGGALRLARGGAHLMIMGWQKKPALGDQLELDLTFERGGTIAVHMPVKPLTYRPGS